MTLEIRTEVLSIGFRDPFRIARHAASGAATTVIVELRSAAAPGIVGLGEGFPDAYYGETPETMAAVMPLLVDAVGDPELTRDGLAAAGVRMDEAIRGHGAAKCSLDIALHDLAATAAALPLHRFLGLSADIPPTDFTVGLDEPAIVAERARRASRFPALKVKVGGPSDLATLRAVREVFAGPIRVDANTAWTPADAEALLPALIELGVELIEQPFPARRIDQLARLQERSSLPIVADESAVAIEDLDGLVGVVAGVNVKLAKCGGVGAAHRMLARARELGFRTFLGCMEETSVGIAASAAVASLADWVDLDGNLLLAADPFEGLDLADDCRWQLPDRPGIGVRRRSGSAVATAPDARP
ncbi:MAG TPA: enolase C-terminal domain-like protein [Candidatus Limnocylindrales bacterium]|nr:enolase C-terminal domain-like protein [Candidatus Limnocylindrales bacterium]